MTTKTATQITYFVHRQPQRKNLNSGAILAFDKPPRRFPVGAEVRTDHKIYNIPQASSSSAVSTSSSTDPYSHNPRKAAKSQRSTLVIRTHTGIEVNGVCSRPYPAGTSRRHHRSYRSTVNAPLVALEATSRRHRGSDLNLDPVAEEDATFFAERFVRNRRSISPQRSRQENKAMATWLGTYLAECFTSDLDLSQYIADAITFDIQNILEKHQPDNAVVFLALNYMESLLPRCEELESLPLGCSNISCALVLLRSFILALSLALKWLDDFTHPVHSWTSAMRLEKATINEMEIHALSSMDWNLSVAPPEWTHWLITLRQRVFLKKDSIAKWPAYNTMFLLLGRSLKEMLAIYSADPFAPLPSKPSSPFPTKRNGHSLRSFWKLLITGVFFTSMWRVHPGRGQDVDFSGQSMQKVPEELAENFDAVACLHDHEGSNLEAHEYCNVNFQSHRHMAILRWRDSVEYYSKTSTQDTM